MSPAVFSSLSLSAPLSTSLSVFCAVVFPTAEQGDILDDRELIGTLGSSKTASQSIEERMEEQKKTEDLIENTRKDYRSVAYRSARFFVVVTNLADIDGMYQFSVEWFNDIFIQAIEVGKKERKRDGKEEQNILPEVVRRVRGHR